MKKLSSYKTLLPAVFATGLFASTAAQAQTQTIVPGPSDNEIAFEAETYGAIDNTRGDGTKGWIADVTVDSSLTGASGGSYLANTEQDTAAAPLNTVTYSIDFQKTGNYTLYYRAAYTESDNDDTARGFSDSFFYEDGDVDDSSLTF